MKCFSTGVWGPDYSIYNSQSYSQSMWQLWPFIWLFSFSMTTKVWKAQRKNYINSIGYWKNEYKYVNSLVRLSIRVGEYTDMKLQENQFYRPDNFNTLLAMSIYSSNQHIKTRPLHRALAVSNQSPTHPMPWRQQQLFKNQRDFLLINMPLSLRRIALAHQCVSLWVNSIINSLPLHFQCTTAAALLSWMTRNLLSLSAS